MFLLSWFLSTSRSSFWSSECSPWRKVRLKLVGTWLQCLTQASATAVRDAELEAACYVTFLLEVISFNFSTKGILYLKFICVWCMKRSVHFSFPYGYQIARSFFQDFLSPWNCIGTLFGNNGLYKYGSISWLYSWFRFVLLVFYDRMHSSWKTWWLKFQIGVLHQWFRFHQVLDSSYLEMPKTRWLLFT